MSDGYERARTRARRPRAGLPAVQLRPVIIIINRARDADPETDHVRTSASNFCFNDVLFWTTVSTRSLSAELTGKSGSPEFSMPLVYSVCGGDIWWDIWWDIWSARRCSRNCLLRVGRRKRTNPGPTSLGRISSISKPQTKRQYECPGWCIRRRRWIHGVPWSTWSPWMGNRRPPQAQNAFSVGRGTALLGLFPGLPARAPPGPSHATEAIRLNKHP